MCLYVHGEGTDNDLCHQACLINTPVMSTPVFHFAIPLGSILKSLSPHFSAHLPSLLLLQSKTSSTSFPYQNNPPIYTSFSSPFPNLSSAKLPNFSPTSPFIQSLGIHLVASSCLSILILSADIPFLWFGLFILDRSCFCKTTLKDGESGLKTDFSETVSAHLVARLFSC